MTLSARLIKEARSAAGLTQTELAETLGTRQQTISEWETGVYQPRGASRTLLTFIAERVGFQYRASSGDAGGETERLG